MTHSPRPLSQHSTRPGPSLHGSSPIRRFRTPPPGGACARAVAGAFPRRLCGKDKPETEVNVDPPDLLYNQALANLEAGDAREASEKFETIDKEHPYSDEARKAMIMSAFLNFRRGKYQDAINDARALRDALPGDR